MILPELAAFDVLVAGLYVVRAGALLHARLADAIVDARRLDDHRALVDAQGEGLFAVDILAGVEGVDGAAGVPVVRRCHVDGVHLFHLEQLAMVGE